MKRMLMLLAAVAFPALLATHAGDAAAERLKLATTTSTVDTGLLDTVLPPFEKRFSVKVDVISVGTGKAMKLAENGDVDAILVHDRPAEDKFVADGLGVNRRDVMYNDFVLLGPAADPAAVAGKRNCVEALRAIARAEAPFVSRGDDSGTHRKEKALWKEAGLSPRGRWYLEAGQGMGETLVMADEKGAYCLADRATFLAFAAKIRLRLLAEGDPRLMNPYGVIAVSPARYPRANYLGAMCLIGWLTSPEGQKMIGDFKKDGVVLFHPDAYTGPGR